MYITLLQAMEAHRGLPALAQKLLEEGQTARAIEVARAVQSLKPEVEMFTIAQNALINAYGELDPASRQRIVKADGKRFDEYLAAQRALLNSEVEAAFGPLQVSKDEVQGISAEVLVSVVSVISMTE